jgi:hypothetical protein
VGHKDLCIRLDESLSVGKELNDVKYEGCKFAQSTLILLYKNPERACIVYARMQGNKKRTHCLHILMHWR